jgi:hypothetical protein
MIKCCETYKLNYLTDDEQPCCNCGKFEYYIPEK